MDRDHFDQHWCPLAQHCLTSMNEWRLQPPTATLSEIEAALDARLGRLRAQMLADAALASAAASWSQESSSARPPCPTCGAPLQSRGAATRDLQTQAGQAIHLTRSYGTCPACGPGLFPPRSRRWAKKGAAPRA